MSTLSVPLHTSVFTLKMLLVNHSQQEANFKNYLDCFSDNVKEIVGCFDLRNTLRKMAEVDVLHDVIEKFVSTEILQLEKETEGMLKKTEGILRSCSHLEFERD